MSSLYLPLALAATFAAVMVTALHFGFAKAERRRTLRLLETQVGPVTSNLRDQELNKSFVSRTLVPSTRLLGGLGRRIFPTHMRDRLERKLALAGNPPGWNADKVAAYKLVGGVAALGWSLLIVRAVTIGGGAKLLLVALFTFIGYFGADGILASRADRRQQQIRKTMADTMDLLTISVEAGLGLDAAIAQVVEHVPGPLAQEFSRLLQEVRLGVPRHEAFRHIGDRTDVEELNSFILAMVQADIFGVSISKVLRAQAYELRTRRRQRAEETAMKLPVKILFPLIFCVLPALLVVIIGPGAIRIAQSVLGIDL